MERRKLYGSIFILIVLITIGISAYRLVVEKTERNDFNQAKQYVESFGWKAGSGTSADTMITDAAHVDFNFFRYRRAASQDIGLNYLKFREKEVKLYAFDIGKQYQDKPLYAHVLIYKGQVIGAYLQSETYIVSEIYIFSLKDHDLRNPYKD